MANQSNAHSRGAALRQQLADLQTQVLQYTKIKELYNVSFDLEMRRLEKAIVLCREAIHAHEGAAGVDVG